MGLNKGSRLGKYQILSQLGVGGMGVVYLAEHVVMRRRVAIKVLPSRLVKDAKNLERFHREAQAIAALDHPNIVRAYSVDNEGAIHYLVMEYVEGRDLEQIVSDSGPLEAKRAAGLIRQAAKGLAHAHERGLIHRDIKPSNLLVDAGETLRILDLGLACGVLATGRKSTAEQEENVVGTTDYLAPEQAMAARDIDGRADIYSLGCTLYYLLTGAPPFPNGSLAERLLKHQMEAPPAIEEVRPDVPAELIDICMRMMEKRPADRYASAGELSEALREAFPPSDGDRPGGSSVTMRRPKLPSADDSMLNFGPPADVADSAETSAIRSTQQAQRQTLMLTLGGVGVAVLLLAIGWWALSPEKSRTTARNDRGDRTPAATKRSGRSFAPKANDTKNLWPGAQAAQPQAPEPPKPAPPPAPAPAAVPAVVDLTKSQSVFTRADEARDYTLVYHLKLPDEARFNGRAVPYAIDNRAEIKQPFDRVAWCLELQKPGEEVQFAFVSCDAWSPDLALLGVPTTAKLRTQAELKNLNIFSNVPGVETGSGHRGGIEFWETDYTPHNGINAPEATGDKFDFGDQRSNGGAYGSMQVHNWDAKQTIFAFNNWGGGAGEAGIGNQPTGNPDWTFSNNIRSYTLRELSVLVRLKPEAK